MEILIAEDDFISSKVLRLTLEHFGHEVLIAEDGAEAWQIFDQEPVSSKIVSGKIIDQMGKSG
jgi:CheY-like chemotaxis protein